MEVWKEVKGFEDYYEVSDKGRVRRKKGKTIYKDGRLAEFSQTILKQGKNSKGYLRVYLSVKSKKYTRSVHRIVAETFLENPENKKTVNHKDCDKTNNEVNNLEWMTNKENMRHAFKNGCYDERDRNTINNLGSYKEGRKGSENHAAILNEQKVTEIRSLRKKGLKLKEIARIYNVSISVVSSVSKYRSWKHVQ